MMRIAIHIGALPEEKDRWSIADWFKFEVISRMLSGHPEEKYLLLSDESVKKHFRENKNVEQLVLGPYTPRVLSMYRRFNYKLPAVLKHANSEVLISLTGILPLKGRLASCVLLPEDSFTTGKPPLREGLNRYRKRYLTRFIQNAGQLAVFSEWTKKQALSQYQVHESKITVAHRGIPEMFRPMDWKAREEVKAKYTGGEEFLLYRGEVSKYNNIINLLKGFTILKKKMNSSMVLVLAGKQDAAWRKFPGLMETYHFRKDVKLTGALSMTELAGLTGAAYGQIVPTTRLEFCSAIPEAIQCHTPLVAAQSKLNEEKAGEAALYFDQENFEDLGERLCELYINEDLRAGLIAHAEEKSKAFSWDKTVEELWEAIQKTHQQTTKK